MRTDFPKSKLALIRFAHSLVVSYPLLFLVQIFIASKRHYLQDQNKTKKTNAFRNNKQKNNNSSNRESSIIIRSIIYIYNLDVLNLSSSHHLNIDTYIHTYTLNMRC